MTYCEIFSGSAGSLSTLMDSSPSAGNQAFVTGIPGDGISDSQGSPALDSTGAVPLAGGTNRWRVLCQVYGGGGIAVATGGDGTLGGNMSGGSVVLDQAIAAGPAVGGGFIESQVIDLGEFQATGTFGGVVGFHAPATLRVYGGIILQLVVFIPNAVVSSDTFTFGGDGQVGSFPVSTPTTGPAYAVTSPLSGLVEYFYRARGSTRLDYFAGFGTRFPVINVPAVAGSDLNFFGDMWQLAGDGSGGIDVTVAAGDTISADYSEYYSSWNGQFGMDAPTWFDPGATAIIDGFWFTIGTIPVFTGPPFINTEHRAYVLDENTDGDSGTVVGSGTAPTGTAPIFDTIHRAYQSDEGTDS